jgi:hypothetical protein
MSLLSGTVADATTYYVATNGSDSNPGTQTKPFHTIQKAANTVRPGDTVQVAPGTYTNKVEHRTHGTANARIRFVSSTKWGARIVSGAVNSIWTNWGNYVDIVDFDISGKGRLGITNYASHVNIVGNKVHDLLNYPCDNGASSGHGILAGIRNIPATDINIIGNVVYDNGGGAAAQSCNTGTHGIYHSHSGIIANNIVYNNRAVGVHAWHEPHDLLIANNLVFNNGKSGILVGGQEGPAHHIRVVNNIVIDNRGNGLKETGKNRTTNQFINNIVFRNRNGNVNLNVATDQGTIVADPQFVNYQINGSGDYRLKSDSPAIDAGITLAKIPCDIKGYLRPAGQSHDIGIHEENGAPSSNCASSPLLPPPSKLRIATP